MCSLLFFSPEMLLACGSLQVTCTLPECPLPNISTCSSGSGVVTSYYYSFHTQQVTSFPVVQLVFLVPSRIPHTALPIFC